MTSESIAAYIQHEIDRGTSENSLRNFKRITESLYEWLSEDKTITKDRLACWRRALKDREAVRQQHQQRKVPVLEPIHSALRSNNTSGWPGVFRKRDKWAARITNQKVTYQLGSYERMEDAIAVRQEAEKRLRDNPLEFAGWIQKRRQSGKQET